MTRKRYTEEQIINILKGAGARVGDLCRRYGMSNASFYNEFFYLQVYPVYSVVDIVMIGM